MKIINVRVKAEPSGPAPVDFAYYVEQEGLLEDGSKIYIQAITDQMGNLIYGISKDSIFDKNSKMTFIKKYSSVNKASKSEYYENFKEVDKILDDTIAETLAKIDDTRNNEYGIRFGAKFDNKGLNHYAEAVAKIGADKYLYMQVQRIDNVSHYSITEKSIYLRMNMGELYNSYYKEAKEITPLIEIDNLDELKEFGYLKDAFIRIDTILDELIKEHLKEEY